jgi:saccharopine dehydrogenase-like NADP-dependent oxidoreductase
MGRYACRIAAGLEAVDELVVADLDAGRAAAFASQLGPGVTSIAADISDEAALARALAGADVVMNTAGPFFRFGVPALSAALQAGCHYVDICDDWEPTIDMLELHGTAVRHGVTAIIGTGASPGITNLLAVLAARELDSVREIVTGWNLDAAQPEKSGDPGPSAALVHGLRQMTGTIRVLRHGNLVDEAPLRRTTIDYPGLGERKARTFGHPEPITLARTFAGLDSSVNVAHASAGTPAVMKSIRWAIDHKLVTPQRALRAASWIEHRLPAPRPSKIFNPAKLPPLFGHATGTRGQSEATAAAALCRVPGTTMGAVTGIPLAVTLKLLAEGHLRQPGVFAPEAILDPARFFAALAAYCPGSPSPTDMVSIARSWDTHARDQFISDSLSARRHIDEARNH